MTTNVVNMDAHLPRADFAAESEGPSLTDIHRASITDLETGFLVPQLRKPDFQRETKDWSPAKVLDLIRTFVDGELIPAIILWQAGGNVFVIDGAHRVSALLAWIRDDYGDGLKSLQFSDGNISTEQRRAAEKVKKLVKNEIGSYGEFKLAAASGRNVTDPVLARRVKRLATNALQIQWMPAENAIAAQNSFLKINEVATPIDATERRIIKARRSASAIASRAITNRGAGYKYWKEFSLERQATIEKAGREIYVALFEPPIAQPIKTLDLPVAGYGYNTLPFVFDLVNEANGVKIADSTRKKNGKDPLPDDLDGSETTKYLDAINRFVGRVTGTAGESIGPHPVVYFYTRSGSFQAAAFLAAAKLFENLSEERKLQDFTRVRRDFEEFLVTYREFVTQIVHKFGSGERSINPLLKLYRAILDALWAGQDSAGILTTIRGDASFKFLVPATESEDDKGEGGASLGRKAKSAAFIREALASALRCRICGARLHNKSITSDHVVRKQDGGFNTTENAMPSHPFCNSTVKN